jgi:hypothetical protein
MMSAEETKALVLEAFDTLFNRRDYAKAAEFWSENYIQHSAHIEPGRDGLFKCAAFPFNLRQYVLGDILECAAGRPRGLSFKSALGRRVNAFGKHSFGRLTLLASVLQADCRIDTKGEGFLLAREPVGHAPKFVAAWLD